MYGWLETRLIGSVQAPLLSRFLFYIQMFPVCWLHPVSVFSAMAEIMLGKSSLPGDMGDYDYSSLSLWGRRKLHGWS